MEFTTLARELKYCGENYYPYRFEKDDLIKFLKTQGVLNSSGNPEEKYANWFQYETINSRYGRHWQRISISDVGAHEIKALFEKWNA